MSTLDTRLATEAFGQPAADPAAVPAPDPGENLPTASAEPEQALDTLPRSGSACRFCGVRAAADALRVGGTYRIPVNIPAPADATNVRRVRLGMDAVDWEAAQAARAAGDMQAYGRAKSGRVLQEVTVPTWRVCGACEDLPHEPSGMDLLSAAFGRRLPTTPTTLYVIERHQVQPYAATGRSSNGRGGREPWAHAAEVVTAAAELLAELERAGGVPAPVGPGCGICGRTHSPYGWREATWRPPGTASATPAAVSLCDGFRVAPGDRSRHPHAEPVRSRVGCGLLVEMPAVVGPLAERIHTAASRDGAEAPHPRAVHPDDRERFMAWAHPEFRRPAGPRPPWWHLADVPVAPPSAEERLAELAKLVEARLAVAA